MASDPCSLIFRVCGGGQAVLLACVYSEHPLAVTSCGLARLPAASSVPGPANGSAAAGASSQSQARDFRQGQAVAVSEAPVYLDRGLHDPAQPSPAQPGRPLPTMIEMWRQESWSPAQPTADIGKLSGFITFINFPNSHEWSRPAGRCTSGAMWNLVWQLVAAKSGQTG